MTYTLTITTKTGESYDSLFVEEVSEKSGFLVASVHPSEIGFHRWANKIAPQDYATLNNQKGKTWRIVDYDSYGFTFTLEETQSN